MDIIVSMLSDTPSTQGLKVVGTKFKNVVNREMSKNDPNSNPIRHFWTPGGLMWMRKGSELVK